eukprot:5319763-Pyramimonas_sp.AAC.1
MSLASLQGLQHPPGRLGGAFAGTASTRGLSGVLPVRSWHVPPAAARRLGRGRRLWKPRGSMRLPTCFRGASRRPGEAPRRAR